MSGHRRPQARGRHLGAALGLKVAEGHDLPASCRRRRSPRGGAGRRVENAFFRYKSIMGDGLRARSRAGE